MKVLGVNEFQFVRMIPYLKKIGVETNLYYSKLEGLRFKSNWKLKLPFRFLSDITNFLKISKKYDIIHVNGAYSGHLPLIAKKPYVLYCMGTDLRVNLYRPIIGKLTEKYIKKADKVVVCTPDLAEYIVPIRKDVIYIPSGIESEIFKPSKKRNGLSILLVSGLKIGKGGRKLMEAIKIVKKHHPEVQVDSSGVGKEPEGENSEESGHVYLAATLDEIKKTGINMLPVVKFGNLSEWACVINRYDIVVGQISSEIRGMSYGVLGVSELEALSCGKPLVGHIREDLYEDVPPVLSSKEPKKIAENIEFLIENKKEREKMGKKSREWILRNCEYGKVVRDFLKIYEEIMK